MGQYKLVFFMEVEGYEWIKPLLTFNGHLSSKAKSFN